jgi:hypothetical protein
MLEAVGAGPNVISSCCRGCGAEIHLEFSGPVHETATDKDLHSVINDVVRMGGLHECRLGAPRVYRSTVELEEQVNWDTLW